MYEFLRQYVNGPKQEPNSFVPLESDEVPQAEARLGFTLPKQLKEFYREVGCGFLLAPEGADTTDNRWVRDNINRVVDPSELADLYLGKCVWGPREGFLPGLLPFFEVGDGTFLVLKIDADSDPGVYWPDGRNRVAPDLARFFHALYKDPSFYLEL